MQMWLVIVTVVATAFALAAIIGAPFLPTPRAVGNQALDLLNLKPGQRLLDLGAGSGTLLVLAAKRGIYSVGYEINPLLYLLAKIKTFKYRYLIDIKLADYWHSDWPQADGIYVFLITRYMPKLDSKLKLQLIEPTPVVSYSFTIPGRKPTASKRGLYLYRYP